MILYAPSYAGLIFALKRYPMREISVITINAQIVEFCTKVGIRCISLIREQESFQLDLKFEFPDKLSDLKHQQVLFCFYGFDLYGLKLIYNLREFNIVYFTNLDHHFRRINFPRNKTELGRIKELIEKRRAYNLPLQLYKIEHNRYFLGISPKKLNKDFHTLDKVFSSEIFLENQKIILDAYEVPDYKSVFIDQGNTAFIIEDDLVDIIGANVGGKLLIKSHPNFPISNEKFLEIGYTINKEIPVELLFKKNTVAIGIVSTALNSVDKKISLANLVKWKNSEVKNQYFSLFNFKENEVPRSIEELAIRIKQLLE